MAYVLVFATNPAIGVAAGWFGHRCGQESGSRGRDGSLMRCQGSPWGHVPPSIPSFVASDCLARRLDQPDLSPSPDAYIIDDDTGEQRQQQHAACHNKAHAILPIGTAFPWPPSPSQTRRGQCPCRARHSPAPTHPMGVGALPDGGRDGPDPKLLCGDRLATTDRIRASGHQHPV
jgi:hypothetical protein